MRRFTLVSACLHPNQATIYGQLQYGTMALNRSLVSVLSTMSGRRTFSDNRRERPAPRGKASSTPPFQSKTSQYFPARRHTSPSSRYERAIHEHPHAPISATELRSKKKKLPAEMKVSSLLQLYKLGTRDEHDQWVQSGRVSVNGITISKMGEMVSRTGSLRVVGMNVPDRPPPTKVWLHNKRAGWLCSHDDPRLGDKCLYKILQNVLGVKHLIGAGRLDINTEGLLVVSNDARVANALTETGVIRQYRARVRGHISDYEIRKFAKRFTLDGRTYRGVVIEREVGPDASGREAPARAIIADKEARSVEKPRKSRATRRRLATGEDRKPSGQSNYWLVITVDEGKNREVRRVLESVGLQVSRLIRVRHGPFVLPSFLPKGDTLEIDTPKFDKLRGPKFHVKINRRD